MNEVEPPTTTDITDYALVVALGRGEPVKRVASISGVSVRTVYRRLASPDFRAKVAAYRVRQFTSVTSRLLELVGRAIDILQGVMRDADSADLKLKAATKVLEFAFKTHVLGYRDRQPGALKDETNGLQALQQLELDTCQDDVIPNPPVGRLEDDGTIAMNPALRKAIDP
jgi:hypothetical protein